MTTVTATWSDTITMALVLWGFFCAARVAAYTITQRCLEKDVVGVDLELLRVGSDFTFLGTGAFIGSLARPNSLFLHSITGQYQAPILTFFFFFVIYLLNYLLFLYVRENRPVFGAEGNKISKTLFVVSVLIGWATLVTGAWLAAPITTS